MQQYQAPAGTRPGSDTEDARRLPPIVGVRGGTVIVGVPSETAEAESRVALVPRAAGRLVERGHEVCVAADAGADAGFNNDAYLDAGCEVVADRATVFERADVLLQVRALGANPEAPMDPYREGQVVVGLLGPYDLDEELTALAERRVSAFAMELVPRISRAQQMDVLTSMANVAGYKSILVAAEASPKMFPLMMTAAGTVHPADVFVVGAGVAGLQAIATADRLGASVRAYDIRPEVKEQVESLGATFVELDLAATDAADEQGRAREQDEAFYERQREMMRRVLADSDVVVTTAAIPGKPSPELVTTAMVEEMAPGSVVVDLAAEGGGNCEPTVPDETVHHAGVTIFGPTNLPATVPRTACELYSNNLTNFLDLLLADGELHVDTADEIVDATLLTHDGTIRYHDEETNGATDEPGPAGDGAGAGDGTDDGEGADGD